MPLFESSSRFASPRETVFEFLTVSSHALKLIPDESPIRVVSLPERIVLGSRAEFELNGFGLRQRIVHEVTEFNAPARFVERQLEGPLPLWIHEYVFSDAPGGETLVVDRVEFQPPPGMAGLFLTEARLRQFFQQGFEHRARRLQELLEKAP